jgi:hypothetical protein
VTEKKIIVSMNAEGVGKAFLKVEKAGSITVTATEADSAPLLNKPFIPIQATPALSCTPCNPCNPGVPVASIKLSPHKARRHCGDSLTITAVAKDANGATVAGAKVTFLAHGDCHPANPLATATTGANGVATYTLLADEPGVASVVASGVGADGAAVLSNVVHVYYEGHHPGGPPHGHSKDGDRDY